MAPAHGDVYSIDRSPGKCLATTVMVDEGYWSRRTSAVVRPMTPAPSTRKLCSAGMFELWGEGYRRIAGRKEVAWLEGVGAVGRTFGAKKMWTN